MEWDKPALHCGFLRTSAGKYTALFGTSLDCVSDESRQADDSAIAMMVIWHKLKSRLLFRDVGIKWAVAIQHVHSIF